eukprot:5699-Heterococcus_DN1.PRE.1
MHICMLSSDRGFDRPLGLTVGGRTVQRIVRGLHEHLVVAGAAPQSSEAGLHRGSEGHAPSEHLVGGHT